MYRYLALALCFIAAGCRTTDPQTTQSVAAIDQVPAEVVTVKGRYDAIAACTFGRLDQTGLRKADLQGETRVMLESSGVRYWELKFRPVAKGTEVAFSRVQGLWGPMGGEGVMDAVKACAT